MFLAIGLSSRRRLALSFSTRWYMLRPADVSPFVVILPLCLFFGVRLIGVSNDYRLFPAVAVLMLCAFVFSVLLSPRAFLAPLDWIADEQEHAARQNIWRPFDVEPGSYQEAAAELNRIGIRPGDRIASLDCSLLGVSMVARLARIKIVAEVNYWPEKADTSNDFWQADATTQSKVIQALASTGARAVISELKPSGPNVDGWQQVGTTRYYVHWLG